VLEGIDNIHTHQLYYNQRIVKGQYVVDVPTVTSPAPMLALMPPPLGSIELGKDADLIIFDDNLDVSWATVQGKPRRM